MAQKRRTIIVEGFQTRFVATEVAWLTVCFALFGAVLIGPLVWQINSGSVSATDVTRAIALLQFHDRLWIPLLALFLGVTWTLVRLSHRVAGPLYRFRQVFEQVAAGDLSVRVRVRENDYLVSEGEEFDRMIGAMRDRVRRSQAAAGALRNALVGLSGATGTLPANQVAALIAQANETEEILAGFVLGPVGVEPAIATDVAATPKRATPLLDLSLAQTLALAFFLLIALGAIAVPAYSSALDHARGMRAASPRGFAIAPAAPARVHPRGGTE